MRRKASLHVIDAQPAISPDVIQRLTEVCEAVQTDQISAVGIAIVYRNGSTGNCWSTSPNVSLLVGAVERLKHRLLKIGEE